MTRKLPPNNRTDFVAMARTYYQNHSRRLQSVDDFDRMYRPKDALRWCFRSPFPSNLLRQALLSRHVDQLSLFRFLIVDASRLIQQPSRARTGGVVQLYRGMKLSRDVVDRFEQHVGHLLCAGDFFPCTKSRAMALDLATSLRSRPDLVSVLFRIECDGTVRVSPTPLATRPPMFVFDLGTTFRLLSFSRMTLVVIRLNAVAGEAKRFVHEYRETHPGVPIATLLNELAQLRAHSPRQFGTFTDGAKVDELLKNGEVDQAIDILRRVQPASPSVLVRLGHLYAEKKGEYDHAFTFYTQALKLQEKVTILHLLMSPMLSLRRVQAGEDISDTVTRIGTIHFERGEYNSALTCHACALRLRETTTPHDGMAIATNLIGIANAHRANHEFAEALTYAQRALTIREALVPRNETLVAKTLATLATIHHELADDTRALQTGRRALEMFERCLSPHAVDVAGLMNNLGAIKLSQGATTEARHYFHRSLQIYRETLPPTHPYLSKLENNVRYIDQLEAEGAHPPPSSLS